MRPAAPLQWSFHRSPRLSLERATRALATIRRVSRDLAESTHAVPAFCAKAPAHFAVIPRARLRRATFPLRMRAIEVGKSDAFPHQDLHHAITFAARCPAGLSRVQAFARLRLLSSLSVEA